MKGPPSKSGPFSYPLAGKWPGHISGMSAACLDARPKFGRTRSDLNSSSIFTADRAPRFARCSCADMSLRFRATRPPARARNFCEILSLSRSLSKVVQQRYPLSRTANYPFAANRATSASRPNMVFPSMRHSDGETRSATMACGWLSAPSRPIRNSLLNGCLSTLMKAVI
jgi:hypothetical protein